MCRKMAVLRIFAVKHWKLRIFSVKHPKLRIAVVPKVTNTFRKVSEVRVEHPRSRLFALNKPYCYILSAMSSYMHAQSCSGDKCQVWSDLLSSFLSVNRKGTGKTVLMLRLTIV